MPAPQFLGRVCTEVFAVLAGRRLKSSGPQRWTLANEVGHVISEACFCVLVSEPPFWE